MDIETPTLPGGSASSVMQLEIISNHSVATESGSAAVSENAAKEHSLPAEAPVMPLAAEKNLPLDINHQEQRPYPFFECISPVKIPLTDDIPISLEETTAGVQSQEGPVTVDVSDKYNEIEDDNVLTGLFEDFSEDFPESRYATDDELWADLQEFLDDKKPHQMKQQAASTIIEACESASSQMSDQQCNPDSTENTAVALKLSPDNPEESQQLSITASPVEVDRNTDVPSEETESNQQDQEPDVSSSRRDSLIEMAPGSAASFTQGELQVLSNLAQLTPISPMQDSVSSEANAVLDTDCAINPEQQTSVTEIQDTDASKPISITIQDIPSTNRNDPPQNHLVSLQTQTSLITFTAPILRSLNMNPASNTVAVVDTTNSKECAILEREKEVVEMVLTRALEAVKNPRSKARQFLENVKIIPKAVYSISSERQASGAANNSIQPSTIAVSTGPGTVDSPQLASTPVPNAQPAAGTSYSQNAFVSTNPNILPRNVNGHPPANYSAQQYSGLFSRPAPNQPALNLTSNAYYPQRPYGMPRPSFQYPSQQGMTYRQRIAAMLSNRQSVYPQGVTQNVPRAFPQLSVRMPVGAGSYGSQPFYSRHPMGLPYAQQNQALPQFGSHQAFVQQSPALQYAPQPMMSSQKIAQPFRQGFVHQNFYGPNYSNTQNQVLGNIYNGFQNQAHQQNMTVPTMSYPMQPQQFSNLQSHNFPQNGIYQQPPSLEATMMAGQAYKRRAEGELAIRQLPKLQAVSSFDSQRFANSPNVLPSTSNAAYQPSSAHF